MPRPADGHRTPWHPLMVLTLEQVLPRRYRLYPELPLTQQAQRIDIVLVRRPPGHRVVPPFLGAIFRHLGDHTLIELKGPTDRLCAEDFLQLTSYACLYHRMRKRLTRERIHLMVIADRLSRGFRQQVEAFEGRLTQVETGVWRVDGTMFRLYCLETAELWPKERLLFPFAREFLRSPGKVVAALEGEERRIFCYIQSQIYQLRGNPEVQAMHDYKRFVKNDRELWRMLAASMPLEERLEGLSPEERLAGLSPEEVLSQFGPEERLEGLSPEEVLSQFGPEERLEGLSPEEVLSHFPPEERLKGLDPDTLVRILPPEVVARLKNGT